MVNEYKLKLQGAANLSAQPKRTNVFVDLTIKNATLTGDIDIRDNDDGTQDHYYKLKITPEAEITILADNEILCAKKKGSLSQALRMALKESWEQQFSAEIEFEDYYKNKLTEYIDEVKQSLM